MIPGFFVWVTSITLKREFAGQAVFCADLRKNEPTIAANPKMIPRIPKTKGTAIVEATGLARMRIPKRIERRPRIPTPHPFPVNAPYRA